MVTGGIASVWDRLRRLPYWDTVFWWFFALYAGFCILWMVVAAARQAWPDLLALPTPTAMPSLALSPFRWAQDLVLSFGALGLGLLVAWWDPPNAAARPFAVALIGNSVAFSPMAHNLLEAIVPQIMQANGPRVIEAPQLVWAVLLHALFHIVAGGAFTYALLLFPDGRLPGLPHTTVRALWGLLLITLLVLVMWGREPSYFMLYCGIVVLVTGLLSLSYKATHLVDPLERAQADAFRKGLLIGFAIAIILAFAVGVGRSFVFGLLGVKGPKVGFPPFSTWALTVLPPLIAATGIMVVIHFSPARPWTKGAIPILMIGFLLVSAITHRLAETVLESLGIGGALSLVGATALSMLEEKRWDHVIERAEASPHEPDRRTV